jgi:signal transduction histidine kinase
MDSVTATRDVTSPAPARRQAWSAWLASDEPHPVRGPFSRWPRTTDGLLALAVFVGSLIAVAVSGLDDGEEFTFDAIGDLPAAEIFLLGLAAAALMWRRRHSIAVTIVVLAIMLAWAVGGYGDGHELALIVAVYSVGRYATDHRLSLATVAAAIVVGTIGTIIDSDQRVDILPAVILTALAWYMGRLVRNRGDYLALLRERAERLDAEQQAQARQAVADERARIARELHDVVAHRVSMMTVQAGAAKTIAHDDVDAAVDAMADVEHAGRQALGELRHLLGVLRPDTADPDDLGPRPGLSDIADLTDELAHTGADVTLTIDEQVTHDLPAAVDLSAYRIVQESLTNVVKHAGPAPTVEVAVSCQDHRLVIDITNSTGAGSTLLPTSGFGIAGMRERATLLGGTLTAGPQPSGRFRVRADLPVNQEPT